MKDSRIKAFPKAVLEQIFNNNTARVLDHLLSMRPFDYSSKELTKILEIKPIELGGILLHLSSYELIEITAKKKYRISDNKRTRALMKCIHDIAVENLELIVQRQKLKERKP